MNYNEQKKNESNIIFKIKKKEVHTEKSITKSKG